MERRSDDKAPGLRPLAQYVATVALGSNLGDREAHLHAAAQSLAELPRTRWLTASPVYETEPVGGPERQGRYLNAVVRLRTKLAPLELLGHLLAIERARGRVRGAERWEPRTLDLDLLLYGTLSIEEPDLRVPHPRLAERNFVLVPLCDLAAGERHPLLGESFAALSQRLPDASSVRPTGVRLEPIPD